MGEGLLHPSRLNNLFFFALVCPRVWTLFILRALIPGNPISVGVFYGAEALAAMAVALILIARKIPRNRIVKTPRIVALGMLVAPLLIALAPQASTIGLYIGAALGGFTMVWCYMQCVTVYSSLPTKQMITYILLSFSIGSIARFPLELIPLQISLLLVAPLPLLCLYMCREARGLVDDVDTATPILALTKEERVSMFAYVTILFLFGCTLGAFYSDIKVNHDNISIISIGALFKTVIPLVILLLLYNGRNIGMNYVCQIGLIVILTLLILVTACSTMNSSYLVSMASDYSRHTLSILLFVALAILSKKVASHPMAAFGLGWSVLCLSKLVGMVFANTPGGNDTFRSYAPYCIYSLVIATLLLMLHVAKHGEDIRLFAADSPAPTATNPAITKEHSNWLSTTYGLTNREQEVVELICRGRSKSYIAERLLISENTVRGYASNAYRKLGIHNRQELIDLVEGHRSNPKKCSKPL